MKRLLICAIAVCVAPPVRADVVTYANDYSGFLQAVGSHSTIDFETQPNGLPSRPAVRITPTFNYDSFGAHFSSPLTTPELGGNSHTGFDLRAEVQWPDLTWIIADLTIPSYAVGGFFGGNTELCAYDEADQLLGCVEYVSSGSGLFVGIVSDIPIHRAIFNRGGQIESIQSFVFQPIPEPCTAALSLIGLACLSTTRRHSRASHCRTP